MVTSEELRTQLSDVVRQGRAHHDRLLKLVDDLSTPLNELVDQINLLEALDDKRDEIVKALRRETTRVARRSEQARSARQLVLAALADAGGPQNAGFLRDYVWAHDRQDLDTRGLASLRRDERRAWQRDPEGRQAYIVPALDDEGAPVSRWMSRSDWPLERRLIVGPEAERRLALERLRIFLDARKGKDAEVRDAYDVVLERDGERLLAGVGVDFVVEHDGELMLGEYKSFSPAERPEARRQWREWLERRLTAELSDLRKADERVRRKAAAALADLSPQERLWGRPPRR